MTENENESDYPGYYEYSYPIQREEGVYEYHNDNELSLPDTSETSTLPFSQRETFTPPPPKNRDKKSSRKILSGDEI